MPGFQLMTMSILLRRLTLWLMLAAALVGCATEGFQAGATGSDGAAEPSATAFLAQYVLPDGRVTRPDQGGDSVSEGQAYGLLLAEAAGRPDVFGRVWQWTRVHLQLPTGLFAYHANAAGRVLSAQPASDADLLIAWALLRYQGSGAASFHQAGQQVAAAVLAGEVTSGPGGTSILAAGPWATGRPATLDPSYWALPALTSLAQLTGNPQWQQLAYGAVALTDQLTADGRKLPPDWAALTPAGTLTPVPAPNGSETQAEYGLDAQRTVLWFAASCEPQARELASRWWTLLRRPGRAKALALGPGGAILNRATNPLPLTAAAAAAQAAGQPGARRQLLQSAAAQQRSHRTYYGGAWAALAPALLSGALGSGC